MIGASDLTVATILPTAVRAATANGADVDVAAYKGMGKLILSGSAMGSGKTNTVKLQHSARSVYGATMTTAGDADLDLNLATGGKTKQAVTFTQSGARSVKSITLKLKRTGSITAGKILTLTLESDAAGDPDGTALGTAATVLCSSIGTDYEWVTFTFSTPVDLADATAYWAVLTSDYTASDTAFISWSVLTVASGGTVSGYGVSWTAVTTQQALFYVMEYQFSDVTGAAFTAIGNAASEQDLNVSMDTLKAVVRGVCTVAGGSATGAASLKVIGKQ